MPDPAPQPRCSFCGKWQNQVRRLVAGPGPARICGECIAVCLEVLDDDEKEPPPRLNQYPPKVVERARRVRLVVLDVDGVMTDGGMYYGEHGEELKKFNTRDGQGIALLHEAGLETAILTREQTEIVVRRGAKLRIGEVRVGVQDKLSALREMLEARGLSFEDVAYIGDDIHDYEVLCRVGLAVVVQDATRKPRSVAHYVTLARGGEGAVRELCELILDSREVGS